MLFLALIHWFTFSSHSHKHLSRQDIIWPHSLVKCYSICVFLSHFHLFHFLPFRLEDLNDSPFLPLTWIEYLIWFQIFSMWWLDWSVHLWLLPVLLLRTLRYVGLHANFFLFRVHGLHLLWLLSDARNCRLPCSPVLRSSHLSIDQMRVADLVPFSFVLFFAGEGRREHFGSVLSLHFS